MNSSTTDPALVPELLVSDPSKSLDPILIALDSADYSLFMAPETKWYRVGKHTEAGVRQFLVTDPDGYLIRFQTSLGSRTITDEQDAL